MGAYDTVHGFDWFACLSGYPLGILNEVVLLGRAQAFLSIFYCDAKLRNNL